MTNQNAGQFSVPADHTREVLCKSCGAPIMFIRLTTGSRKWHPVDKDSKTRVRPDPDGQPWVTAGGEVIQAVEDPAGTTAYRSHFATCPAAAQHRRRTTGAWQKT